MPPDPDARDRFLSADVCRAAGITPETLKNWVSRKPHIVLLKGDDLPGGARGAPNLYSVNRVLQLAIMAEMVRFGWDPRPAAWAAVHFTDIGETVAYWEGETPPNGRLPGKLFEHGETILVAAAPAEGDENPDVHIMNVKPTDLWSTAWSKIQHKFMRRDHVMPAAVLVLDLSPIVIRVRSLLGLALFE